jgi:hypothetical protein
VCRPYAFLIFETPGGNGRRAELSVPGRALQCWAETGRLDPLSAIERHRGDCRRLRHAAESSCADGNAIERHNLRSDVVPIVFPAEANEAVAVLDQAAVGDRDSMGVAAQVFLHRRRSVKGRLGIDHSFDVAQSGQLHGKSVRIADADLTQGFQRDRPSLFLDGIGADQPGGQFDDIGQVAGLAASFDQSQCRIDPADGNGSQFERDAEGTRIRAVSHGGSWYIWRIPLSWELFCSRQLSDAILHAAGPSRQPRGWGRPRVALTGRGLEQHGDAQA